MSLPAPKSHVVVDNDADDDVEDDDNNDDDVDGNDGDDGNDGNDVDVRNETDFFSETSSKVVEMPRSNFRTWGRIWMLLLPGSKPPNNSKTRQNTAKLPLLQNLSIKVA